MNHSFNITIARQFGQEGAVIVENIYFWLEKNKANNKHFYDGKYWTYNSTRAFSILFPYWSSRQIERILKGLEANGAILSGNYNKSGYDRTKWYAVTSIVESIYTNGGMETTEHVNGITQTVEPIPYINTNIKPIINHTEDIAEIRNKYQGTKCKKDADNKLPKLIKTYGKEQLLRGIDRYIKFVEVERLNGFPTLKFKNESTYWNGGYMDYLDENFKTEVATSKRYSDFGAAY